MRKLLDDLAVISLVQYVHVCLLYSEQCSNYELFYHVVINLSLMLMVKILKVLLDSKEM